MLEALVLHRSLTDPDGVWYSLGVYEQREGDFSYLVPYEVAAEDFRKRAEYEYERPVKLVSI